MFSLDIVRTHDGRAWKELRGMDRGEYRTVFLKIQIIFILVKIQTYYDLFVIFLDWNWGRPHCHQIKTEWNKINKLKKKKNLVNFTGKNQKQNDSLLDSILSLLDSTLSTPSHPLPRFLSVTAFRMIYLLLGLSMSVFLDLSMTVLLTLWSFNSHSFPPLLTSVPSARDISLGIIGAR